MKRRRILNANGDGDVNRTEDRHEHWQVRRRGVGVSVPECSRACLIRLVDYPELPLSASIRETLKSGRSALVVKAELSLGLRNVTVAYKRFQRRNWWKVVTGMLRRRRALRGWRLGRLLRRHGVNTPQPLAAVVPRGRSDRIDSYLATEWIDGASLYELPRILQSLPLESGARSMHAAAVLLGGLVGKLHAAGFTHRDLKPGNLMVSGDFESGCDLEAHVIDLDGVKRPRNLARRDRVQNVSRLAVGMLAAPGVTPSVRLRFLRAYLASSSSAGWTWQEWWRQLAASTEQRRRRRQQKPAA